MTTPVAILVNGLPGAGKTTLAGTLSRHLELPMFSKDIIKEAHAAVAVKRPELMVRCPPSGNLNAPVMALAWRAADFIIAGSRPADRWRIRGGHGCPSVAAEASLRR